MEDLESFTLDDAEVSDDDDEEPEEGVLFAEMPAMPVLTPDAGKIRFAEDIVEESRGGGGRNRGRRSGANRARGPRRGGR